MRRKAIYVVLFLFIAISLNCARKIVHFQLIDKTYKINPNTIAVVAGTDKLPDVKLAEYITDELKSNGKFKVVSQKQIAQLIPGYPNGVVDFKVLSDTKNEYISETTRNYLSNVQQKSGVKYIMLIWHTWIEVFTNSHYDSFTEAGIQGRLLVYPESQVRGFSRFVGRKKIDKLLSNQISPEENKYVEMTYDEMFKSAARGIVKTLNDTMEDKK